jgi:DUF971 family protein
MAPKQIKIIKKSIFSINWIDGSNTQIKFATLRRYCPCALCKADREERGEKYIPIYSEAEIEVKRIETVGNYALSLYWGDNHSTGLYDFDYLMKLSQL